MSAAVKLSSAMPGDPGVNGIDDQRDDLVKDPRTIRIAICWYDVAKTTVDTDTDDHTPTIRLRRIEPLGDVDKVSSKIQDLIQDAIEKRTGRTPLPFDLVEADGHDPDQLQLAEG